LRRPGLERAAATTQAPRRRPPRRITSDTATPAGSPPPPAREGSPAARKQARQLGRADSADSRRTQAASDPRDQAAPQPAPRAGCVRQSAPRCGGPSARTARSRCEISATPGPPLDAAPPTCSSSWSVPRPLNPHPTPTVAWRVSVLNSMPPGQLLSTTGTTQPKSHTQRRSPFGIRSGRGLPRTRGLEAGP